MASTLDAPLESERPRVVTESRILTPALVVMLGSTPALAGLELMRHMLSLQPDDLRRVALVYIDTDDPPNALVDFQKQHKGLFQESPLRIAVPAGTSNAPRMTQPWASQEDCDDQAGDYQDGDDREPHTFIPDKVPQYFANGAGGIRNNGHVAACFGYQSIYNTIDAALGRITRVGNIQGEARAHEVQANLVAFLGGGTGSGILADVAVMIRELLASRQFKQRINLFCLLPEPIRGANDSDLRWRKSNATASLLELLAFSQAAAGDPQGYYEKYMRMGIHRLTNDPIANEIYLIGRAGMGEAVDTARIIGIDLFQRIADASGIGFLEHSKWVDRRSLGQTDDRGLSTMFGTSCPLEVRFPAEETATAFAQISAARLLPLIASYRPKILHVEDNEKRLWLREWRNVVRFDANANDPMVAKLPEFRKSDFENANQANLDILWGRVEKYQKAIVGRIGEIIETKSKEELRLIAEVPKQAGDVSLLHDRIQYLQRLQQEYETALEDLKEKDISKVSQRPVQQEVKLTKPNPLTKVMGANHAGAVCEAYNNTLRSYANATRYRLLEALLKNLGRVVDEALSYSLAWFRGAEADERARKFKETGMGSQAWQGQLAYPHPHQRHIFDLRTLRTQDGHNVAVERLYLWATGGDTALEEGSIDDYSHFLADCVAYITLGNSDANSQSSIGRVDEHNPKRLADRVVNFFYDKYTERFQDINLFELLDKATPRNQRSLTRAEQIRDYLLEHLQHIRGLMASLVAFEAELWHEGLTALDSSVYLGMHWRDGGQKRILDEALDGLGPLTERAQSALMNAASDPHRLEIAYGQHGISLSTVRDFYLDLNSSMEAYLYHQKEWEKTGGKGNMPVHSSRAAEYLVRNPNALVLDTSAPGYGKALSERVIRRAYSSKSSPQRGRAGTQATAPGQILPP